MTACAEDLGMFWSYFFGWFQIMHRLLWKEAHLAYQIGAGLAQERMSSRPLLDVEYNATPCCKREKIMMLCSPMYGLSYWEWGQPISCKQRLDTCGLHTVGDVGGQLLIEPAEGGGSALVPQQGRVHMVHRCHEVYPLQRGQTSQHTVRLCAPQNCRSRILTRDMS